jgi:hypothetical protein
MDTLDTLKSLGLTLPSGAELFAAIVFGLIGWAAWRAGRRTGRPVTRWLGLALMFYPYLVSGTAALVGVGLALCGALAFAWQQQR